jgi:hypothetical protein
MTATTATSELTVTDLSANIGAEIRGVDISRPLSPDTVAEIRRIWPDRKVVFFPERSLDRGHPVIPGLKTHPEVFEIGYTAARELCATTATSAGTRASTGIPTSPSSRDLRWARSSARSSCPRPAATRCSPTNRRRWKD